MKGEPVMTTFTSNRPIGSIHITTKTTPQGTLLTRSSKTFMGEQSSQIEVSLPTSEVEAQLLAWANGAFIQDALTSFTPAEREWVITGIQPGHRLNPLEGQV